MTKHISKCLANEKGFTLIELMVVVIILGVLAAIAVPTFSNQADRAKEGAAQSDLKSIKTIIDLYKLDAGKYPEADAIDDVLQDEGINWTGDQNGIKDPWGKAYTYYETNTGYAVFSYGKDGEPGNGDDLYVTEGKNPTKGTVPENKPGVGNAKSAS